MWVVRKVESIGSQCPQWGLVTWPPVLPATHQSLRLRTAVGLRLEFTGPDASGVVSLSYHVGWGTLLKSRFPDEPRASCGQAFLQTVSVLPRQPIFAPPPLADAAAGDCSPGDWERGPSLRT